MFPYSYQQLAKLYRQLGQNEKALPNLIELHRRTMNDPQYARQIAETYRTMGKNDQALEYLKQVAHINPYEVNAYEAMAAVHREAEQYDKAVAAIQNVCILQPKSADAWAKSAMMRFLAGRSAKDRPQLEQARKDAEQALELDADSQAKQILDRINRTLKMLGT